MKDYKAIWNNLSTSFADATFNVCCTGDEEGIRRNGVLTAEFLRSVLAIEPTDAVLEIGCGVARVGRELASYCREWHGVDISGNMIAYARERTAGIPNVHLHELPENSLSIFPDNSFDCVYSTIVFMHLDKMDVFTYIREAQRVLKPGGRAYFDTFNLIAERGWEEFVKTLDAYPYGTRPGHVSQFSTPPEMRKFLQEAGFDDVHIDDQNEQLVVALGHKPAATQSTATTGALDTHTSGRPAGMGADQEAETSGAISREQAPVPVEVRVLTPQPAPLPPPLPDPVDTSVYPKELEAEIARKNAAITDLERRLRRREAELIKARRPRLPWKRRR